MLCGVLWAAGGAAAQVLLQQMGVTAMWLTATRLIVAGGLIAFVQARRGRWSLRLVRPYLRRLLLFSWLGVAFMQVTFYATIAASNVASATLLQYLAPTLVVIYESVRLRAFPAASVSFALALSLLGTVFVIVGTGGRGALSTPALVLGLLSAAAFAFHAVYPAQLVRSLGAWTVAGTSFLIAGLSVGAGASLWRVPDALFTARGLEALAVVIVLGTLVPFGLYYASLAVLPVSQASIATTSEPVAAACFAWWLLGSPVQGTQILGGALVVVAVILLTRVSRTT